MYAGKIWIIASIVCLTITSCTTQNGIFSSKKSPREEYASRIEQADLHITAMGKTWNSVGTMSLQRPSAISLPYLEKGYFAQDKPSAVAYRFQLRRGEMVNVAVTTVPATGLLLFVELWQPRAGQDAKFLLAADTTGRNLQYEADDAGEYIVRVQPELLKSVEYSIKITTAASLAFPVRKEDKPRVTSFWGADRDGGARSHEGVDIFAKRLTPLIAAADGRITRVNENTLGGKVVFLQPSGKNYSLYYAHLDSQLVTAGQQVKTGDVVGLMGNTGNARTTSPHLHFGIYTGGGAVDPLPFIEQERREPEAISSPTITLGKLMRTKSATTIYAQADNKSATIAKLETADVLSISAATKNWYRVELPSGVTGFASSASLTNDTWKKQKLNASTRLLDTPDRNAPSLATVDAGSEVTILGKHSNYLLVRYNEQVGWVVGD